MDKNIYTKNTSISYSSQIQVKNLKRPSENKRKNPVGLRNANTNSLTTSFVTKTRFGVQSITHIHFFLSRLIAFFRFLTVSQQTNAE